ncbi:MULTISPECIES: hypothetical protein [Trichocoleus]|uniref:Uncharacterized protein n=1 Tax=Trichocoleus desertorum GB2-A4 TaxID=2933944 RepID=A0ABV0JD14_9CYAN|nr:hypothetical protein [Trichocoleus sp. FACHB-46]MBD1863191.1 hypothetical protein [Trichocoleus sp. FACHB-46]
MATLGSNFFRHCDRAAIQEYDSNSGHNSALSNDEHLTGGRSPHTPKTCPI